jgi:hypothetical protein
MSDDYLGNVQTLPARPSVNGKGPDMHATPDTRGNMIANRSPWIGLPAPFDNLEVRVWLDYPQSIAELWTAPENETKEEASARMMEACKSVILAHRGAAGGPWEDEHGALPSPDTDEFWERIPTPLARVIVEQFFEELNEAAEKGKSRASRRANRRTFRRR